MESIELTGRTIAEATGQAAAKLGVEASQIEVSVLEESKGLFGKSSVRIRAIIKPATPEPASSLGASPMASEPTPAASKGRKSTVSESSKQPVREKPEVKSSSKGLFGKKPPRVESNGPASSEESAVVQVSAKSSAEDDSESEEPTASLSEVVASEKDAEQLAKIVSEILDLADLDVVVKSTTISGRYVSLELDGVDVAYLIGKHGEVLNAFQYLLNVIASRKIESGVRATLDGNHYRDRREEALTHLATQIADQVKERSEEAVLDALPAFERRIVHKALSSYDGVTTYSEGEEPNRRVIIAPGN